MVNEGKGAVITPTGCQLSIGGGEPEKAVLRMLAGCFSSVRARREAETAGGRGSSVLIASVGGEPLPAPLRQGKPDHLQSVGPRRFQIRVGGTLGRPSHQGSGDTRRAAATLPFSDLAATPTVPSRNHSSLIRAPSLLAEGRCWSSPSSVLTYTCTHLGGKRVRGKGHK